MLQHAELRWISENAIKDGFHQRIFELTHNPGSEALITHPNGA
jgi:hypothetical protein